MKIKMGRADRIIRVLIAVAILILYFTHTITGTLSDLLLAVGLVFLLTSLVDSCPLYTVLGIKTCRAKNKFLHP